ncbi:hypothetical protein DIPPA_12428 [Diplonema papillatum]|nr:hypothetical protein DIPPA_12428 [Diplonema papillatum]
MHTPGGFLRRLKATPQYELVGLLRSLGDVRAGERCEWQGHGRYVARLLAQGKLDPADPASAAAALCFAHKLRARLPSPLELRLEGTATLLPSPGSDQDRQDQNPGMPTPQRGVLRTGSWADERAQPAAVSPAPSSAVRTEGYECERAEGQTTAWVRTQRICGDNLHRRRRGSEAQTIDPTETTAETTFLAVPDSSSPAPSPPTPCPDLRRDAARLVLHIADHARHADERSPFYAGSGGRCTPALRAAALWARLSDSMQAETAVLSADEAVEVMASFRSLLRGSTAVPETEGAGGAANREGHPLLPLWETVFVSVAVSLLRRGSELDGTALRRLARAVEGVDSWFGKKGWMGSLRLAVVKLFLSRDAAAVGRPATDLPAAAELLHFFSRCRRRALGDPPQPEASGVGAALAAVLDRAAAACGGGGAFLRESSAAIWWEKPDLGALAPKGGRASYDGTPEQGHADAMLREKAENNLDLALEPKGGSVQQSGGCSSAGQTLNDGTSQQRHAPDAMPGEGDKSTVIHRSLKKTEKTRNLALAPKGGSVQQSGGCSSAGQTLNDGTSQQRHAPDAMPGEGDKSTVIHRSLKKTEKTRNLALAPKGGSVQQSGSYSNAEQALNDGTSQPQRHAPGEGDESTAAGRPLGSTEQENPAGPGDPPHAVRRGGAARQRTRRRSVETAADGGARQRQRAAAAAARLCSAAAAVVCRQGCKVLASGPALQARAPAQLGAAAAAAADVLYGLFAPDLHLTALPDRPPAARAPSVEPPMAAPDRKSSGDGSSMAAPNRKSTGEGISTAARDRKSTGEGSPTAARDRKFTDDDFNLAFAAWVSEFGLRCAVAVFNAVESLDSHSPPGTPVPADFLSVLTEAAWAAGLHAVSRSKSYSTLVHAAADRPASLLADTLPYRAFSSLDALVQCTVSADAVLLATWSAAVEGPEPQRATQCDAAAAVATLPSQLRPAFPHGPSPTRFGVVEAMDNLPLSMELDAAEGDSLGLTPPDPHCGTGALRGNTHRVVPAFPHVQSPTRFGVVEAMDSLPSSIELDAAEGDSLGLTPPDPHCGAGALRGSTHRVVPAFPHVQSPTRFGVVEAKDNLPLSMELDAAEGDSLGLTPPDPHCGTALRGSTHRVVPAFPHGQSPTRFGVVEAMDSLPSSIELDGLTPPDPLETNVGPTAKCLEPQQNHASRSRGVGKTLDEGTNPCENTEMNADTVFAPKGRGVQKSESSSVGQTLNEGTSQCENTEMNAGTVLAPKGRGVQKNESSSVGQTLNEGTSQCENTEMNAGTVLALNSRGVRKSASSGAGQQFKEGFQEGMRGCDAPAERGAPEETEAGNVGPTLARPRNQTDRTRSCAAGQAPAEAAAGECRGPASGDGEGEPWLELDHVLGASGAGKPAQPLRRGDGLEGLLGYLARRSIDEVVRQLEAALATGEAGGHPAGKPPAGGSHGRAGLEVRHVPVEAIATRGIDLAQDDVTARTNDSERNSPRAQPAGRLPVAKTVDSHSDSKPPPRSHKTQAEEKQATETVNSHSDSKTAQSHKAKAEKIQAAVTVESAQSHKTQAEEIKAAETVEPAQSHKAKAEKIQAAVTVEPAQSHKAKAEKIQAAVTVESAQSHKTQAEEIKAAETVEPAQSHKAKAEKIQAAVTVEPAQSHKAKAEKIQAAVTVESAQSHKTQAEEIKAAETVEPAQSHKAKAEKIQAAVTVEPAQSHKAKAEKIQAAVTVEPAQSHKTQAEEIKAAETVNSHSDSKTAQSHKTQAEEITAAETVDSNRPPARNRDGTPGAAEQREKAPRAESVAPSAILRAVWASAILHHGERPLAHALLRTHAIRPLEPGAASRLAWLISINAWGGLMTDLLALVVNGRPCTESRHPECPPAPHPTAGGWSNQQEALAVGDSRRKGNNEPRDCVGRGLHHPHPECTPGSNQREALATGDSRRGNKEPRGCVGKEQHHPHPECTPEPHPAVPAAAGGPDQRETLAVGDSRRGNSNEPGGCVGREGSPPSGVAYAAAVGSFDDAYRWLRALERSLPRLGGEGRLFARQLATCIARGWLKGTLVFSRPEQWLGVCRIVSVLVPDLKALDRNAPQFFVRSRRPLAFWRVQGNEAIGSYATVLASARCQNVSLYLDLLRALGERDVQPDQVDGVIGACRAAGLVAADFSAFAATSTIEKHLRDLYLPRCGNPREALDLNLSLGSLREDVARCVRRG